MAFASRLSFGGAWLRRAVVLLVFGFSALAAQAAPLKVLWIGDSGHHKPAERLRQFAPVMLSRGIELVYTEDMATLTLSNLKRYDALLIYANIDAIAPAQDQAIVDYVTQGGGLVPLHSATWCFRNSERYVAMVGAQFKSHGTGTFRTRIVAPDHPVMQGFTPFESWDETYVHIRHNEQGRTVLEMRENEPWTWVRSEGKGRVFYTAWGHDERTWSNPGFQDLVERGIRFAAGQKLPDALASRQKIPGFELIDQPGVPYYPPGQRSRGDAPWPKMPKPLSAADSMQHLVVPAGFEVQLVAGDPDIKKPVALGWDERGRLWIAETLDYPNRLLGPGEPGRDRLVICDDTNNDGKADKFTVFADGLNIPTSFTFSNGGVIVHQMPNTLFLKDTDGDDKADVREVLITGWGRSDTHAGPSNLRYGLDNWIWGMVGYSGFQGTVGGREYSFKQGFYRFRPDGSALEFLRATNNNTWGLGLSEAGVVFGSTANNNPSVYLPIPDRYYQPAGLAPKTLGGIADTSRYLPITDRVRQVDVHWGYTSAAGHALYTARAYPKEYWNRVAFVTEPTGHLVGQFNLEGSGGNYRSKNPTNLIASDDEWFAPIMAEVGPDGAVWVIDWYNYIVQHNPTPRGFERGPGNAYENELRDKRFGRIYRIAWKGDAAKATLPPPFSLAGATPAQLVAALANNNLLWRSHAQRLLVERARKDVVPALIALAKDQSVDEIGLNVGAIHALWTLHGLNAIDGIAEARATAVAALRHPSAGVRRNAVAVLPHTSATANAVIEAGLLNDSDGQVRLASLLALADCPETAVAGEAIHSLLATPDLRLDRWTVDAAKIAAAAQSRGFLNGATPAERSAALDPTLRELNASTTIDSFEGADPLASWDVIKSGAGAEIAADAGRGDGRSLRLAAANDGSDLSATRKIKVQPNSRYELSAWIKTQDIVAIQPAPGAFISVPEIRPTRALSNTIRLTSDWTQVRVVFDTGKLENVSIVCRMGDAGATGVAWFDDVVLTNLGLTDETVVNPLRVVLSHVLSRHGEAAAAAPVPTVDPNAVVLDLGVIPDVMKYDRTELTVKAGQKARLAFKNKDHMQHNVVLIRIGSIDAVGKLADAMLTDPQALSKSYVPSSPDVLAATPLVNPGESFDLAFTAPTEPGRYPIVCTFPGHWRIMQMTLVVTAAN
ncbi:MAG TPA: PVC-type heme-binding CxxCH protein [Opitutaceae bacterium]|nr:PVC-type heme-binding CxxCH protein [Opitutaceae bacterium]